MEAATSSVLASAFRPSMERMVLFATMSAPSGFDVAILKNMGVSMEDVKKYSKKED